MGGHVSNECSSTIRPVRTQETVLLVEDDPSVRQMMQWALEDEGITVGIAVDGQQAVDWISRQKPALVLLDMGLPLVDGDGVAGHLHNHYGDGVPIVVVTADGHAAAKAARVGAVDYLQKPFDVESLVQRVRRLLDAAPPAEA